MTRKFIVYCISLIVLSLFASPAFAQVSTPSSNLQLPTSINPTSPIYTDLLIHNMFHTFSCLAVGQSVIGQPCLTYLNGVPVLSQVNLSGGTLGAVTGVIGLLYQNPPVRTYESLAGLGQTLGIVKEAKAQGVVGSGAGVLQPIQTLWQVSRNISYVIMIVIFVVIGMMVMFRQRINPQTVITAQAAIPGLVIGLILITFSYFLAGLISDTAFIGTNLVGYYFQAAQGNGSLNQNFTQITSNQNILTIFSKFVGIIEQGDIQNAVQIVFDSVSRDVQTLLRFAAGIASFQIGAQIGHVVPVVGDLVAIATGLGATLFTAVATPIVLGQVFWWVAMAILIYAMLKLLLRLVNSYLTIIFLTVTAPFQFLFAALPGRQGMATDWIQNMLANVLVFPAVLAVFYFVAFLLGRPQEVITLFEITSTASITNSATLPLLGGLKFSLLQSLVAFGALAATPAIPDVIVRTIGKASQTGQLIGQEISSGIRGGQGYAGGVQQQTFGAFGTVGQSYQTFRGRPPLWSPASDATAKGWKLPGWLKHR